MNKRGTKRRGPSQTLLVLSQIWSNKYPPDQPKDRTFIEKLLLSVPLVPRVVSPVWLGVLFFRTERAWSNWVDLYVFLWLTGLLVVLFAWHPNTSCALSIVVGLSAWRIIDILSYQLCIILIDSQRHNWRLASLPRSFLFSLINLAELIIAYAIIYLLVGNVVQNTPQKLPLQGPIQAFYYSLVTMVTLGYGEFLPANDFTRIIVIAELFTEILFVLAIIPVFVANLTAQIGGRQYIDLDTQK